MDINSLPNVRTHRFGVGAGTTGARTTGVTVTRLDAPISLSVIHIPKGTSRVFAYADFASEIDGADVQLSTTAPDFTAGTYELDGDKGWPSASMTAFLAIDGVTLEEGEDMPGLGRVTLTERAIAVLRGGG